MQNSTTFHIEFKPHVPLEEVAKYISIIKGSGLVDQSNDGRAVVVSAARDKNIESIRFILPKWERSGLCRWKEVQGEG